MYAEPAVATTEELVHAFNGKSGGGGPASGLTPDGAGSFYGTTLLDGSNGQGVVFKLTRVANSWTETVIYNFKGGSEDGANPTGTLARDSAGNIYGTTLAGGEGYGVNSEPGYGTVFELSPSSNGWTERVIHFFNDDGSPSGLILDAAGDLYGEAGGGGTSLSGTVYEMKPGAEGWTYQTLYNFEGGDDGQFPVGGLIFDAKGNLYGATVDGGPADDGTVFELQRGANGSWTEKVLYAFQGMEDGVGPEAGVIIDKAGNLYGTAGYGGDVSCAEGYGCGEVFELTPSISGTWTKTTLHAFTGAPDGHAPSAALTLDSVGDLFGTTTNGGETNTGALFELERQSDGSFVESILHSFTNGADGGYPATPLIIVEGALVGTAGGGEYSQGVVFAFTGATR